MINIDLSLLASGLFDIRITKDKLLFTHTSNVFFDSSFKVTTSFFGMRAMAIVYILVF